MSFVIYNFKFYGVNMHYFNKQYICVYICYICVYIVYNMCSVYIKYIYTYIQVI